MIWEKINIRINNKKNSATAPTIISASRASDIPAFFAQEFMQNIQKGYIYKTNPFNGMKELISFQNTRLIVFWSKYPAPIIPHLNELTDRGINYYFQFTLNDYEKEGLEPFIPPLQKRIETFTLLSEKIGKEKVIWRFDPVLLLKNQDFTEIIQRIENIAKQIHAYTEKLVFSFADFSYRKVQNKLKKAGINYRDLRDDEKKAFAEKLANTLKKYNLQINTCAQKIELSQFGISHNKCIDDELIERLFPHAGIFGCSTGNEAEDSAGLKDPPSLALKKKDKGQRKYCGCIYSKDIGQYNTCSFMCTYCYANTSAKAVHNMLQKIKNSKTKN